MNKMWRAALLTGAAFAVPAAVNLAIARGRRELLQALPGDDGEYAWPMGRIAYQVRGNGPPLVLVHGIGAGESAYEWRCNFDALSSSFCVYALDLPGFGKSARPNLNYTADLYLLALIDFLRDVVQQPAYVIASSLSGAFVAKLAYLRPELIEKLVLVYPTGLEKLQNRPPIWSQLAYGAFSLPAIGPSIYNGIASYGYIESYLRQNLYVDPTRVTRALVEHYYQSAHQPGGHYALRSFIAGLLNCDLTDAWPELQQPILLAWGRHAKLTPIQNARAFLDTNNHARLKVFELSGLRDAGAFNAAVTTFLTGREAQAVSASSSAEVALALSS